MELDSASQGPSSASSTSRARDPALPHSRPAPGIDSQQLICTISTSLMCVAAIILKKRINTSRVICRRIPFSGQHLSRRKGMDWLSL